jgi:hypothetical protein
MYCSGDKFQAKADELLGDTIVGVKTYIDDILVIHKDVIDDHLEQVDVCFNCIQKA